MAVALDPGGAGLRDHLPDRSGFLLPGGLRAGCPGSWAAAKPSDRKRPAGLGGNDHPSRTFFARARHCRTSCTGVALSLPPPPAAVASDAPSVGRASNPVALGSVALPVADCHELALQLLHLPDVYAGAVRFPRAGRSRTDGTLHEHGYATRLGCPGLDDHQSGAVREPGGPGRDPPAGSPLFPYPMAISCSADAGSDPVVRRFDCRRALFPRPGAADSSAARLCAIAADGAVQSYHPE